MKRDDILTCDCCGRFVAAEDVMEGRASHRYVAPDSAFTTETWETLCPKCKMKEAPK